MFPRVSGAALVAAMMLSGCVDAMPQVSGSPSPKVTPVFATEEEALAAATEAYAAYQRGLDTAFATYDDSALPKVASGTALSSAIASVREYRAAGKHGTGITTVDTISLANGYPVGTPQGEVSTLQIYLCLDVTNVDVLAANGVSVIPDGSPRRFPLVAILTRPAGAEEWRVSEEEGWTGVNFC
ncbi:MAG: hypothetical protein JWM49_1241 [Microbacteriaceae bacterium]|nr:hypothetical protein [Microbacteriaceae bacterium]